jgi:hypothetical protein
LFERLPDASSALANLSNEVLTGRPAMIAMGDEIEPSRLCELPDFIHK